MQKVGLKLFTALTVKDSIILHTIDDGGLDMEVVSVSPKYRAVIPHEKNHLLQHKNFMEQITERGIRKKWKFLAAAAAFIVLGGLATLVYAEMKPGKTGEELFKEHCSVCHPDGGNIINSEKTQRKADREMHNIMTKSDIVEKMRHPGKGMTSWSAATIPDEYAEEIAVYILNAFK